jgi:hypothetical protein
MSDRGEMMTVVGCTSSFTTNISPNQSSFGGRTLLHDFNTTAEYLLHTKQPLFTRDVVCTTNLAILLDVNSDNDLLKKIIIGSGGFVKYNSNDWARARCVLAATASMGRRDR